MKLLAAESTGKIIIANNKAIEPPNLDGKDPGNYVVAKKSGENVTHVFDNGEVGAARRVYYVTKS
jgi:hypothetical protein